MRALQSAGRSMATPHSPKATNPCCHARHIEQDRDGVDVIGFRIEGHTFHVD